VQNLFIQTTHKNVYGKCNMTAQGLQKLDTWLCYFWFQPDYRWKPHIPYFRHNNSTHSIRNVWTLKARSAMGATKSVKTSSDSEDSTRSDG